MEPKVVKEEIFETSNQSGRDNNDDTNNEDPIGTPAHISCIIAKDTLSFLVRYCQLSLCYVKFRENTFLVLEFWRIGAFRPSYFKLVNLVPKYHIEYKT